MNNVQKKVIASILLAFGHLISIDNPHFYRANFFWKEPRFEKPWLTTFDINIAGGQSKTGRNADGETTPILNIYGLQNIQALGNVPGLDPNNPLDALLINLAQLPANNTTFAHIKFTGKFDILEGVFSFYQNFTNGFFAQLYIPFRHINIKKTTIFHDCSPETGTLTNTTPEWVAVHNNFNAILRRFCLSTQSINELGFGDFAMLLGWTINYEKFDYLDYLDVTAKIGGLFPTAKKRNNHEVFSIPLGYDGHFGIPIKFDMALGYWEWLTAGMHIGALFLLEEKKCMPIMTTQCQPSYFLLTKAAAEFDPGTIWEVASYAKSDHIWRGLSLLVGYTYTQKDDDCIQPQNCASFDQALAQANPQYKGWDMHVLHFNAEWDFTRAPQDIGPRIGFFYNYIAGGKRIFNTAMKDGSIGFDIAWCF